MTDDPSSTHPKRPTSQTPRSRAWTILAYFWLLRVPILIALLLFALPVLALIPTPAKPVVENFFVLGPFSTFWVSLATLLVAGSILLNALVVLFNAVDRFLVRATLSQDEVRDQQRKARWYIAILAAVISAPLLFGQFLHVWKPDHPWLNLGAVLLGGFVAYLLAYGALWFVMRVEPRAIDACAEIFPAPALQRRWLKDAHETPSVSDSWHGLRRFLLRLPRDLTAGIIDDREFHPPGIPNRAYGLPWPGVWLGFTFALLTAVVYVFIGASNVIWPGTSLPALCFVLIILLNVNWIFGFGAYFFDRFRFPLLAVIAVFGVFAVAFTGFSEHYYRLSRLPEGKRWANIAPSAALRQKILEDRPIVIVTTMGGGIQAAAWTVRVLTGLQEQLSPDRLKGRSFADSIAMVSSVSGGATGALFFLNEYRAGEGKQRSGFLPKDDVCGSSTNDECTDLSKLVAEAEKPGLDNVAWALAYLDFPRVVAPLLLPFPTPTREGRFLDRGRMLELSWTRIAGTLSDWQTGIVEGWRPASIFNATIAETGEPLFFATTNLDEGCGSSEGTATNGVPPGPRASWRGPQPMTFACMYEGFDIDLVTAARLASGFPYVLPVPRAMPQPSQGQHDDTRFKYHIIDGGYYDNYGVTAAVHWLDRGLDELSAPDAPDRRLPRKVLVLQIRSFPDLKLPDVDNAPNESDADYDEYEKALPKNRSWVFELYSPVFGLARTRKAGQILHRTNELRLLKEKWAHKGVDIRFATFEFDADSAPLSFMMNPSQTKAIQTQWEEYLDPGNGARYPHLAQVKCLFADLLGGVDPLKGDEALKECESVRQLQPF